MTTAPELAHHHDIQIVHQYRVLCPQCGELPDSPFYSMLAAREARTRHWQDHRDERI